MRYELLNFNILGTAGTESEAMTTAPRRFVWDRQIVKTNFMLVIDYQDKLEELNKSLQ